MSNSPEIAFRAVEVSLRVSEYGGLIFFARGEDQARKRYVCLQRRPEALERDGLVGRILEALCMCFPWLSPGRREIEEGLRRIFRGTGILSCAGC